SSALNFGFLLGFFLCCIVWLTSIFHFKRTTEDAGLFEEMSEAVFIIDCHHRTILCVNKATVDLLGFQRHDLIHRAASHLFAGNETVVDKLLDTKNFKKDGTSTQMVSTMRKDGSLIDMHFVVRSVRYHGAHCVLVSGRDVSTKLKVIEDQARLSAILESSTSGLCACDREGIIVNWNRAAARILGYRPKDVIGKPFMILVTKEQHKKRWEMFQTLIKGKVIPPYEGKAVHKDGRTVYVHMDVAPIRNENGEVIGISAIFRDIGDSIKTQRELKEKEERLQMAFQAAEVSLWDYDCDTDTLHILSEYSSTFLGYDYDDTEWSFARVSGMIHPKDRQQSEIKFQQALTSTSDEPFSFTSRFLTKKGSYRWINVTGQVSERNEDGSPKRVIGLNRDMSQKMLERQREECERLRLKTLLAWSERSDATRKDILEFTLQKSVDLTSSPLGLIGEVDETKEQLNVTWLIQGVWPSKTGRLAGHEATAEQFAINGSPLWTKAVLTGEPMIANAPDLDAKDRNFFGVHNPIERYLAVPIIEEGRIAGVVMVANKEEDYAIHDVIELQLLAQGMWNHMHKIDVENSRKKLELEHNIILENLQEGVICFNQNCQATYVNRFACEVFGRSPEEIIGRVSDDAELGEKYCDIIRVSQEVLQTKKACYKEIVSSDGQRYNVKAMPVLDEEGELFHVVETFYILCAQNVSTALTDVANPLCSTNENTLLE
ncbi:MAG: PAS domain S-box protein, partial [Planctomycetia bacterium]